MPKNYLVENIRSKNEIALDIKSKGYLVKDVKPKNLGVGEMDDVIVDLYAGMPMGPGWYMYVTYPIGMKIYP